jgi:hypothetical protein
MFVMPACFNSGDTIYFPFDTYDSSGGSVTITGLAVTDIEVYKNGSTTQRASDNGYTLLDTDGIDFDATTGLHGFSIDTSDNSDASFWADGSQYWVNINAITVDSQTVRFTYYLVLGNLLRPTTAGRKLDVSSGGEAGVDWANVGSPSTTVTLSGTTVKTATDVETDTQDIQSRLPAALVSGKMDSDATAISGDTAAADNLEKQYDGTGYGQVLQRTTIATLASQTSFTLTAGSSDNDAYNDCIIVIEDASTAAQKAVGVVDDYTGSTKTITLRTDPAVFTMATTDIVTIIADRALKPTVMNRTLDVAATGEAGLDFNNILSSGLATLHSLTITGAFTVSGGATYTNASGTGFTCSSSGGNGHGMLSTGNGSGCGFRITSGSGASSVGLDIGSAGTGASDGIRIVGSDNGSGLSVSGGSGSGSGTYGALFQSGINGTGTGIYVLSTSNDALKCEATTSGNGLNLISAGSSKHGLLATGGTSGTCDGIKAVAGTGGVPIRGDITGSITGNITGNLSGTIGGFTTSAKAEVESEVNDALVAQKLDHLVAVADADDVVDNSIIAKLASKSATADWSSYVNTTDSLEANRDNIGTTGAALTTVPWNASWDAEVQSEVQDAIEVNQLDHLVQVADPGSIVANSSLWAKLHSKSATPAYSSYDNTTDSLEAVRDKQTDIETDTQDIQSRLPASLVSGRMDSYIGSLGTGVITASSIADGAIDRATFAADTGMQTIRSSTAQTGAAGNITLDASASAVDDFYNDCWVYITGGTGVGQCRRVSDYVGSTKVATVEPNWATNPDSSSTFAVLPFNRVDLGSWLGTTPNTLSSGNLSVYLANVTHGGTAATFQVNTMTVTSNSIAWNTNWDTEVQSECDDALTANASIVAIKAKTDSLTFTVAANLDCNVQRVNDVLITGNGQSGSTWGP